MYIIYIVYSVISRSLSTVHNVRQRYEMDSVMVLTRFHPPKVFIAQRLCMSCACTARRASVTRGLDDYEVYKTEKSVTKSYRVVGERRRDPINDKSF